MSQSPNTLNKEASDDALELRFPEHPWREPMPVLMLPERVRLYACRFCAWREGYLIEDAKLWGAPERVIEHLRVKHPPKKTDGPEQKPIGVFCEANDA